MKSSVVFPEVNVYLELGCPTYEHIILQSTCCLHYQCFAATVFIEVHNLGGLYCSVLLFCGLVSVHGCSCHMAALYNLTQKYIITNKLIICVIPTAAV
jgi:hypothetical protein